MYKFSVGLLLLAAISIPVQYSHAQDLMHCTSGAEIRDFRYLHGTSPSTPSPHYLHPNLVVSARGPDQLSYAISEGLNSNTNEIRILTFKVEEISAIGTPLAYHSPLKP